MRLFTRVAIFFYVLTLSVLCGMMILFVAHAVTLPELNSLIEIAYDDSDIRMVIGIINAALIIVSFMSARIIYGSYAKERTIAFDNPTGRVTISLHAIEDLVRRVMLRMNEIKEVKTNIIATKKGLEVESRLVLKAEVNIPEMTAHLQEMVKTKIQDTIGIEESVVVKIHVIKITAEDLKAKKNKANEDDDRPSPTLPFQGYRA